MAEKKKPRKRKEEPYNVGGKENGDKPSKDEYSVARWLRTNVPTKKTKFLNHHVEYFTGSKAIDALLKSEWATGGAPLFTERAEIVAFLNDMLVHRFFHRALKVPVTEQELKGKGKKKDGEKPTKEEKKKEESVVESQGEGKDGKGDTKEKEKRKRKIRLDMHLDQVFVDGLDAYVWIYNPTPFYYWLFGALLVLGAIGVCMFPLWPPSVRKGVYYLSVAAACFLVLIIALTTLRLIVFCLVWVLTLSRHHLWLLPNLTEDVGFFASFWPLYHYEYRGPDYVSPSKDKGKKKKKKDKCSDDEMDPVEDQPKETVKDGSLESDKAEKTENDEAAPLIQDNTESESESSQRSSTGKDFEMVDPQDVETS